MLIENTLIRSNCLVCYDALEYLANIKHFPVYSGATLKSQKNDQFGEMKWMICSHCGTIQLGNLMPLDAVYQENHSDAVGGVWQNHNIQFAEFIRYYGKENRLEIGGATGKLASLYKQIDIAGTWTIVEPNPIIAPTSQEKFIKLHKGWFDDAFRPDTYVDTIIHSHVMEHWYDPRIMLSRISDILPIGGRMICSVPRLDIWLRKKYMNCFSFEHTYYLDKSIIEYLAADYGLTLQASEEFDSHSLFLCFEKQQEKLYIRAACAAIPLPKQYDKCRAQFLEMMTTYKELVTYFSQMLLGHEGNKYIFGAHLFSQYLFALGLKEDCFISILDNSPLKQGKRLYGTGLMIASPQTLKNSNKGVVLLNCGVYNDEIRSNLIKLNSNLDFISSPE